MEGEGDGEEEGELEGEGEEEKVEKGEEEYVGLPLPPLPPLSWWARVFRARLGARWGVSGLSCTTSTALHRGSLPTGAKQVGPVPPETFVKNS